MRKKTKDDTKLEQAEQKLKTSLQATLLKNESSDSDGENKAGRGNDEDNDDDWFYDRTGRKEAD